MTNDELDRIEERLDANYPLRGDVQHLIDTLRNTIKERDDLEKRLAAAREQQLTTDDLKILKASLEHIDSYAEDDLTIDTTKEQIAACLKKLAALSPSQPTPDAGRTCTCHPDDNPPVPCAEKYALSECRSQPTPDAGEKPTIIEDCDCGQCRALRAAGGGGETAKIMSEHKAFMNEVDKQLEKQENKTK